MFKYFITALLFISCSVFASGSNKLDMLQAVKPCAEKLNLALNGKGSDPTKKELDKCVSDLKGVMPQINRDLGILLIGYLSHDLDKLNEQIAKQENAQGLTEISATKLAEEFKNNELQANELYKGKSIVVTGKVNSVRESFNNIIVSLSADEFGLTSVDCHILPSEKDRAIKLQKGQKVKLKGTVSGLNFVNVLLSDAVFL